MRSTEISKRIGRVVFDKQQEKQYGRCFISSRSQVPITCCKRLKLHRKPNERFLMA
jgi:hypothetical protein